MATVIAKSFYCLLLIAFLFAYGHCHVVTYPQITSANLPPVASEQQPASLPVVSNHNDAKLAVSLPSSQQDNNNNNNKGQLKSEQVGLKSSIGSLVRATSNKAGQMASGFGRQLKDWVHSTVENHQKCWNVMTRLHNWYNKYTSLYDSLGNETMHNYTKPVDLLQVTFAQVDHELSQRLLEKAIAPMKDEDDDIVDEIEIRGVIDSFETVSYLFKALKKVVKQLEASLEEIESSAGEDNKLPSEPVNPAVSRPSVEQIKASQEYRDSMDRVKRILVRSAEGFVSDELLIITRTAGLNALANHITTVPPEPGTILYNLAPLITLIGAVNTPFLVSYFNTIQVRTVLGVLDSISPAPKMVRKFFSKAVGK